MTPLWSSLFCRSESAAPVVEAVTAALVALDYQLFDPFGTIVGQSFPRSVRLFVAPAASGWVRVIGDPDPAMLPSVSAKLLCLWLRLDASQAQIQVYENGQPVDAATALLPFLRPNVTAESLNNALMSASDMPPAGDIRAGQGEIPLDVLPDDVKQLAGGVNPAQAQKLFARMTRNVMQKVGGNQADDARALIAGAGAVDWDSPGGRQIRALAACLTLPDNWREPDFTTLRDAYQLHHRRQRRPDARLYPGDAEAMARVPDALSYTPVYGGKA